MIQIENREQLEKIINDNSAVVLDFYADWCSPCKQLLPILEKASEKQNNVVFCKINVDDNTELANEYNIRSIPSLKYIKNKEVVLTTLGFKSMDEIIENSNELL